jgi:SAM-dependent methyltransferase
MEAEKMVGEGNLRGGERASGGSGPIRETYTSPSFIRRHDPARPGNRYLLVSRQRALAEAIENLQIGRGARYLEVGCGNGQNLEPVDAGRTIGFRVGVDLLPEQLIRGRAGPARGAGLVCGDARLLPFADASFDVVAQVMLLSAIVDRAARRMAAVEMLRVLRAGGYLLSLDLRYPRLFGCGRTSLGKRALQRLFPGLPWWTSTCGLLPPLARALAAWDPRACDRLAAWSCLRVYRLVILRNLAYQAPVGMDRVPAGASDSRSIRA